ncbi:MAG: U32 family peptidase [bacterium]|nr:U32 family peptidase [bacterium]
MKKKVELLAPAGNIEGFYSAIYAGADAVYLAGNKFGARAYADNFQTDELVQCIRYAHIFGRKVHLTVNTLIKESEFNEIYDFILPFYEAGLDAVIVQDIGVFHYLREHFPGLSLHVSTQMTTTGVYGGRLLKTLGAERIVPARELSLEEIKDLKKTDIEVESFIHGAMCYCYSGQCLFSSIIGGRSGNRGRCAQPCRLPYNVECNGKSSKECYPLSLKDMCTIEHIYEFIDAGIDSFKIEGRMKKPEYTAGVTAIYRKYIDEYYHQMESGNKPKLNVNKKDLEVLSQLYIRSERQDGYYYKKNGKDMISLYNPSYVASDDKLIQEIQQKYVNKKLAKQITATGVFEIGKPAKFSLKCDGLECSVYGQTVESASKQPVTEENLTKQLSKFGDSVFELKDKVSITMDDNIFFPLKALNEMRRNAVVLLEEKIITRNNLVYQRRAVVPNMDENFVYADSKKINMNKQFANNRKQDSKIHISVEKEEQLLAIEKLFASGTYNGFGRIYINSDLFTDTQELTKIRKICENLYVGFELAVSLPYILRKRDYKFLDHIFDVISSNHDLISGVLVRNLEGLAFLKEKNYAGKIYADAGVYCFNNKSIEFMKTYFTNGCLPYELKEGEALSLLQQEYRFEKIMYGYIPMMQTANCISKTMDIEGKLYLVDRYKKRFPVEKNCKHCTNIIYNCIPLSLHNVLSKWKNKVDFRLNFTIESYDECKEILKYYNALMCNETDIPLPFTEYTTGHEKRGVE